LLDLVAIGEPLMEFSCEGDMRTTTHFQRNIGGDVLNTVIAASRLGSRCGLITRLGSDPFASIIKQVLHEEQVETFKIRQQPGKTGIYFVNASGAGPHDLTYYRHGSAASLLDEGDITVQAIRSAKIVYATGITMALSHSCRQATIKAFKLAKQSGVMTAFDPNYRPSLWPSPIDAFETMSAILPYCDIILPTFPEDLAPFLAFKHPEQVIDYFWIKGAKLVVVKVGYQGCFIGYNNEKRHIPALSVQPVDTVGAGDTFNGAFLHGLANQVSMLQAAKLGVTAAGLKVLRKGILQSIPYKQDVYSKVFNTGFES
jgi:2-dehydro-3-deoxygluconokinase